MALNTVLPTIPCDVTVILSRPTPRTLRDSTITYRNVSVPTVPIPRGAYAVLVPQTTQFLFTRGSTIDTISVDPGYPIPLADLAIGSFGAPEGQTIDLVSFLVAVQ